MKEFFFNDRGIYYRTNDFEKGRLTLVFIHGLSGSSSAWEKYERYFEQKYNVLSFDLRGHGKSKKPGSYADYEIKKNVKDIYELFKYLRIENCVMVSHSFAVLIALEFLAEHQELVKASVFLSPSFSVGKRFIARLLRPLLTLSRTLGILPFSEKPGYHIDYVNYPDTGDWNIPIMFANIKNTTLRVYLYCTLQSYTVDREDLLRRIKMPVLIMHGKRDTIFPVKNSLVMAEKIKGSRLIILNDIDHILVLNRFREVSQAIENFINML